MLDFFKEQIEFGVLLVFDVVTGTVILIICVWLAIVTVVLIIDV